MSCETLDNATNRMKEVLEAITCDKHFPLWCKEHKACDICREDAFQHVLGAFERERELISEREYDRGYQNGRCSAKPFVWDLDQNRSYVAKALEKIEFDCGEDSHSRLSKIASAIHNPRHGWTIGECRQLIRQLRILMGEVK